MLVVTNSYSMLHFKVFTYLAALVLAVARGIFDLHCVMQNLELQHADF